MKIPWRRAFSCSLSLLLCASAARAADTNPPPRLTVELQDGSRVVGASVEKRLRFHSPLLGDLKLPVADLRSVDCVSSNSAKLVTTAGDTLTVSLLDSSLAVKTGFGRVELAAPSIRRFVVSEPVGALGQRAGLIALWPGEGDGRDLVGHHDAQVSPGVSWPPAKKGLGFSFDGHRNQVTVADAPDLNFGPGQDFSIEAWIKPLPPPPYVREDIMSFVDKRETPNNTRCLGYEFNLWYGKVHCRLSDSLAGLGMDWGPAGPDLRDGRFHHVVLSVQRNSPAGGKMYVDGQVALTFDPTGVPGDLTSHEPLRIGNHPDPAYPCFFHGMIDELALFNRALTAAEVSADFTAGGNN